MNEQTLKVLEQYDFKVYKAVRARGGFLCNTSKGVKLLCQCDKPDSYYERECRITEKIRDAAEFCVDAYVRSAADTLLVENEEGKFYVKDWSLGREFNTDVLQEVEGAARLMAHMHIALDREAEKECDIEALIGEYERHARELKSIWNYLKAKKGKNSFELLLYKNFKEFFNETEEFRCKVWECNLREIHAKKQLSHNCFDHHNILLDQIKPMIVNFDKVKAEPNMVDLYRFMRKILEKHGWNMPLAYKMIEAYDSVKTISQWEQKILACLFTYPEKFWKIANYYYNSSKAWMPEKNTAKLSNLIEQNENRKRFVKTLG